MPELPEVETTVRQLKNEVLNRTFLDVWTDFPKMIKTPETFKDFKKKIKRKKIERIYMDGSEGFWNSIKICLNNNKSINLYPILGMDGELCIDFETGDWELIKGEER